MFDGIHRRPIKCGCDHAGKTENIDGHTSFQELRKHIKGEHVLDGERGYNIHHRARHA